MSPSRKFLRSYHQMGFVNISSLSPFVGTRVVVELTLEDAGSCHGGDAHACGGGQGVGGAQVFGLPASSIRSLRPPIAP